MDTLLYQATFPIPDNKSIEFSIYDGGMSPATKSNDFVVRAIIQFPRTNKDDWSNVECEQVYGVKRDNIHHFRQDYHAESTIKALEAARNVHVPILRRIQVDAQIRASRKSRNVIPELKEEVFPLETDETNCLDI